MQYLKKYSIYISIIYTILTIIFNQAVAANIEDERADYYGADEGRLLLKLRASGIMSKGAQSGFPAPVVQDPKAANHFIANGYGGDVATTIFFNDNIASELSLGFWALKTKYSTLDNIAYNYNGTAVSVKTKRSIYSIPLTLTGQYHIAPFGAIRPYVGAGVHGTYLFTNAKGFRINNSFGPILQIGADFIAMDDTLINLNISQYYLKAKVKYSGKLVANQSGISSTAKISPMIMSIGIGFKL